MYVTMTPNVYFDTGRHNGRESLWSDLPIADSKSDNQIFFFFFFFFFFKLYNMFLYAPSDFFKAFQCTFKTIYDDLDANNQDHQGKVTMTLKPQNAKLLNVEKTPK